MKGGQGESNELARIRSVAEDNNQQVADTSAAIQK